MLKLGNLHLSIMWTGVAILWLTPDAKGTWHWAVSWANPAMQWGRIGRQGYGGTMWDRKSRRNVGVWAR